MDRIRIRGGHPLKGEIPISGAKNAALKLMASSILTPEPLDPGQCAAAGGCARHGRASDQFRRHDPGLHVARISKATA